MIYEKPENMMPKITILQPNITITGRAIPDDASRNWYPFILKLEKIADDWQELYIIFEFSYYNTSSSIYITRIMYILEGMRVMGKNVVINWKYFEKDEDMQISGEYYMDLFPKLNINLNSYK
jgi:hypothetical protein